ncbi:MAG: fused MFS/spermidine synthase, partial [Verrucomicrobiota bacterium]
PLLGGSPAVWNTCMCFFQAALLAGYAYAHFASRRLNPRTQVVAQVVLLAIAAVCLPIAISPERVQALEGDGHPAAWVFGALLASVGLPFFVVSTSAPLLQRWFSLTGHASARDPYFLYAASNLGSLLILLAFPVLLEPVLRLRQQSVVWTGLYGVLLLLVLACGATVWKRASVAVSSAPSDPAAAGAKVTGKRRALWILLAFVPSSLMLGVTTYLTTDIATIPLLWVVPLALYLLTFVLVFGRKDATAIPERMLPAAALALIFLRLSHATEPAWVLIFCNLLFFFSASMVCHGRLAAGRPAPEQLTDFYFCMSIGGVLGGLFNALLAPLLFSDVWEYPLVIVVACMLGRATAARKEWHAARDIGYPLAAGLLALALVKVVPAWSAIGVGVRPVLMFGVPLLVCYLMTPWPARFGLALGAVMVGGSFHADFQGNILKRERNFFGVSRITTDERGRFNQIFHGNTIHGRQFIDAAKRCEPLTYYHQTGPLGFVFNAFRNKQPGGNVALIGLGCGIMGTYSRPGEQWTIYEIDPVVASFARDTNYFTYLSHCSPVQPQIVLGDARLRLQHAPDKHYDMILLDAFSSDAIPVHLITREALALYLGKLKDGGMIVWHISNRFLYLDRVVAGLAADAGLVCRLCDDLNVDDYQRENGKEPSQWVVIARRAEDLGAIAGIARWEELPPGEKPQVWSDDFSNVLGVFKWK